jgi:hypothetical protein
MNKHDLMAAAYLQAVAFTDFSNLLRIGTGMTQYELKSIHGGLTHTSKMPGPSFSLPMTACKTGAKLAKVGGTPCSKCYAFRGNYRFDNVRATQELRLELLHYWMENDPALWVEAMVQSVTTHKYFRWHDSGDVQNDMHLSMINEVAMAVPDTHFWLPTQEVWVSKAQGLAPNLLVRLSATKIDGAPRASSAYTSTVVKAGTPTCPAHTQGNQCGSCRMCWDKDVKNVAYKYH